MEFKGKATGKGVCEREFELQAAGRKIPGLLWTPEGAMGARPLVLLGHGGSGDKRMGYIMAMGRRLVRHSGYAACAIDGPVHGDRIPEGFNRDDMSRDEFRSIAYTETTADNMIADWKFVLENIQKLDEVGKGPIGYWGVSMGTIFGLPLIAAEPRIQVAVLGLMGSMPGYKRLMTDAPKIHCPVLFVQQLQDELISRENLMALFDDLGTTDKRLHANPGKHSDMPPDQFTVTENFLIAHLGHA